MIDQNTDFEFDIRMEDNYIRVESGGVETPERMNFVYQQIIEKINEWKCNRILYIEGFSNQISVQDMLIQWIDIFRKVDENNVEGYIAVFDHSKDDHAVNLISESLANAHGINARVFNNINDAIKWLKGHNS